LESNDLSVLAQLAAFERDLEFSETDDLVCGNSGLHAASFAFSRR
jgi:hypothetical protein